MKDIFEDPKLNVIRFTSDDVVTANSGPNGAGKLDIDPGLVDS